MDKYRKKPVIIEAIQYIGTDENKIKLYHFMNRQIYYVDENEDLIIKTLEGDMIANIGDYIIKGVHGEYYPCKPDIFKKTYEIVEETN